MSEAFGALIGFAIFIAVIGFGALFLTNSAVMIGERLVPGHPVYGGTLECRYFTGTGTIMFRYDSAVQACPRWRSLAVK